MYYYNNNHYEYITITLHYENKNNDTNKKNMNSIHLNGYYVFTLRTK